MIEKINMIYQSVLSDIRSNINVEVPKINTRLNLALAEVLSRREVMRKPILEKNVNEIFYKTFLQVKESLLERIDYDSNVMHNLLINDLTNSNVDIKSVRNGYANKVRNIIKYSADTEYLTSFRNEFTSILGEHMVGFSEEHQNVIYMAVKEVLSSEEKRINNYFTDIVMSSLNKDLKIVDEVINEFSINNEYSDVFKESVSIEDELAELENNPAVIRYKELLSLKREEDNVLNGNVLS